LQVLQCIIRAETLFIVSHAFQEGVSMDFYAMLYFARDKMKLLRTSGKRELAQSTSTRRFAHAEAGV
jgi:hypothetical protein